MSTRVGRMMGSLDRRVEGEGMGDELDLQASWGRERERGREREVIGWLRSRLLDDPFLVPYPSSSHPAHPTLISLSSSTL
jgi:hypothetical protein